MSSLQSDCALVVCPHTDDEFGCGGTIVKLLSQGTEVHYAAFSSCEESVPRGLPSDTLAQEMRQATKALGLTEERTYLYNFRVRHFPSARQHILEELVQLRERIRPDLVLLPALDDIHQDHQVMAIEGLRAFKFASVLGYELPMNTITFRHACFVSLTETHLDKKIAALLKYKSQGFRSYANEEFMRSLACVRGTQAGVRFAEAFEVLRLVT